MSEKDDLSKNLTCVLFPGNVKNDDKALECLGGIRKISQMYSMSAKERLGLCFRPENPNSKKIFADKKKTSGLLLKVKVRKTVTDNGVEREVVSTSAVGRVNHMYSFNSLCDFQYLPLTNTQPPGCLLDKITPSGLDSYEKFLTSDVDPFIVPASFARTDRPLSYSYTDKKEDANSGTEESENIHYRRRNNRKNPKVQYTFNLVDEFPKEPHQYFIEKINKATKFKEGYDIVQKLFEERPIWSRNAIRYKTGLKNVDLKIIMPSLSYSFRNGPWKLLWVRYGYDPRQEPESRKYQCLDFRLRNDTGLNTLVAKYESVVYNRKVNRIKKPLVRTGGLTDDSINEATVVFRPGIIPSQRQIYYQYCDVDLEEVKELVLSEPPEDIQIHPSRGWLAPGVADRCRESVSRHAKAALHAAPEQSTPQITYESSSSSDDEDSASLDVTVPEPSTSSQCKD